MRLLVLLACLALTAAQLELGCVMTYAEGEQAPKPCPGCMPAPPPEDNPLVACQQFLPEWGGQVCCGAGQTVQLLQSMPQLESSFVACGACITNFWRLFCEFTCSPYQVSFMQVLNTKVHNNQTLVNTTSINFDLATANAHYDSCKNIPFGGGEVAYRLWGSPDIFFNFIGAEGGIATATSPPTLMFALYNDSESVPNNQTTLGYPVQGCEGVCGCQTCPSECEPPPHFNPHINITRCTYKLGGATFECLSTALAALAAFGGIILAVLTGIVLHRVLWFTTVASTSVATLAALVSGGLFAAYMATAASGIVIYASWGVVGLAVLLAVGLAVTVRLRVRSSMGRASVGAPGASNNINGSDVMLWHHERSFVRRYWMWHGRFVATHPIAVLLVCLVITTACASGLARLQIEQNPEKLWVSPDSRSALDKAYFDSAFGPFYRIEQLIITVKSENGSRSSQPILTPDYLTLALEIQLTLRGIQVEGGPNGTNITMDDLCYKPVPGQSCIVESPLQWFGADANNLAQYAGTAAALAKHIALCTQTPLYSTCLSDITIPTDANVVLGGYDAKLADYMNSTAIVMTFLLNNAPGVNFTDEFAEAEHGDTQAQYVKYAMDWEAAFIAQVQEYKRDPRFANFSIAYSAERSVQDELARESGADVRIIAISYILMFLYVSLALGGVRFDLTFFLHSKVMLAFAGIVLVICSVLASAGINSYVGVKATLIISEVIPFLVLAIGVDNIFIIVAAFETTPLDETVADRLGHTLAEVGSGVVVAGLSEAVAFLLGSFTRMPAVQAFAFYAALAVLFDFVFHLTAFSALLALDARRAASRRVDCLPCVKVHSNNAKESKALLPSQRLKKQSGGVVRWMVEVIAPFILHPVVKMTLIAAFVLATLCSIHLATHLQVGLDQRVALPSNSYLIDYFDQEASLLMVGPPLYLVIREPYDYTSIDKQNKLCYSQSGCEGSSLVNFYDAVPYTTAPVYSWLDDYLSWASSPIACCYNQDDYAPCFANASARPTPDEFVSNLPTFLDFSPPPYATYCQIPGYVYSDDVVVTTNATTGNLTIGATRLRTYHSVLRTQADYVNALRIAYEVADQTDLPVFPYSVFYIYFEQYLYIVKIALLTVGLALGGVFIVSLFLLADPWLAFLIVVTVTMAEIDLLGVMHYWDISINAVSVTNLVMAVGIYIEFCVHIAARFADVEGTRAERAHAALVEMGSSVLSGITLTKFIGVAVLAFSSSDIFKVYYFRMYLSIVLIGAAHGLIFLPILLSLAGTNAVRKCIRSAIGCRD